MWNSGNVIDVQAEGELTPGMSVLLHKGLCETHTYSHIKKKNNCTRKHFYTKAVAQIISGFRVNEMTL